MERLFRRMRKWLAEADPDGIIKIDEGVERVREEGLGRYPVPRLDLHAFGRWVGIVPKARNTVASAIPPQRSAPERAAGRVDITDEVRRYVLYRFRRDPEEDVWMLDDLRPGCPPRPLDQEAFEMALMSYLR